MKIDDYLDVKGLTCPMPLLKAKQHLNKLEDGQVLEVQATDPGTERDFKSFMALSHHELVKSELVDGCYIYYIRKGS